MVSILNSLIISRGTRIGPRKIVYLIIAILLCVVSAAGQTATEENARLREHLNIGPDVPIHLGRATLPPQTPLKVFIATGLDLGVQKNFQKWLEDWNKKNGRKFGQVDVVPDVTQADVILARYVDRSHVVTETRS